MAFQRGDRSVSGEMGSTLTISLCLGGTRGELVRSIENWDADGLRCSGFGELFVEPFCADSGMAQV